MVAKHKGPAAPLDNSESLGEINMMTDPPPGLPPGLEQGIMDYINNGIAAAGAQMNIDMQTLAKQLALLAD